MNHLKLVTSKFKNENDILMFDRDKNLKNFNLKFDLNDNVLHVRYCENIKINIIVNNEIDVVNKYF